MVLDFRSCNVFGETNCLLRAHNKPICICNRRGLCMDNKKHDLDHVIYRQKLHICKQLVISALATSLSENLKSVECGAQSVVWSVECKLWSVESKV